MIRTVRAPSLASLFRMFWYQFTPSSTGEHVISTCDTINFDSDILVYSGSCGALTPIACNGDGTGCGGLTSSVSANLNAGETVLIRVEAGMPLSVPELWKSVLWLRRRRRKTAPTVWMMTATACPTAKIPIVLQIRIATVCPFPIFFAFRAAEPASISAGAMAKPIRRSLS